MDEPVGSITVTLCGSTRFRREYEQAAREETLKGRIVLSVGLFGHQEGLDMSGPVKAMLDELHLRKIDKGDEVLVIAPRCPHCLSCGRWYFTSGQTLAKCACGEEERIDYSPYVGESTRREISYAESHGKVVRYWSHEHPEV